MSSESPHSYCFFFFFQIIDMIMYVVCCCFCRGYRTRDGYETHGESGRAKKKKKGKEYRPAQSAQPQSRSFVASGSYQSAVPVHSYGGTDNLYQNVTPPPAYQAWAWWHGEYPCEYIMCLSALFASYANIPYKFNYCNRSLHHGIIDIDPYGHRRIIGTIVVPHI